MNDSGNKHQNPFGNAGQMPVPPPEFIRQIAQKIHLVFVSGTEQEGNVCLADSPEVRPEYRQSFSLHDLQHYLYAVFCSSACEAMRRTGAAPDFSRIPHPKDADTFWRLAGSGAELREIHRLENRQTVPSFIRYPESGNNVVSKVQYENERVYINDYQYFTAVSPAAWAFHAGGGPVLQNWLRERMGRALNDAEILYCQKIVAALEETVCMAKEVDGMVMV